MEGAFEIPKAPMDFISMDLIGEFYPPSTRGNRYALTIICMLTGWVWCVPIPDKTVNAVLKVYLKHVHHVFGPSRKILSDNGTEFKNDLFDRVAKELGVEHKVYSPPYHSQSNGRIEGFHLFLKACMAKHISPGLEWDEVCPIATAAYNFLPNEHAQESPFFLMFGRDPRIPLTEALKPRLRYLGNDDVILSLEALKNMYLIVKENLRRARGTGQHKGPVKSIITLNQLVTLKVHLRKTLAPQYEGNYRVVAVKGNQVELAREGTEQREPTARRDSTGGPPWGRSVDRRAGSSTRQRSRTKDNPKAGGYRPLRRRDVTFETRGGANTIGDEPRSG